MGCGEGGKRAKEENFPKALSLALQLTDENPLPHNLQRYRGGLGLPSQKEGGGGEEGLAGPTGRPPLLKPPPHPRHRPGPARAQAPLTCDPPLPTLPPPSIPAAPRRRGRCGWGWFSSAGGGWPLRDGCRAEGTAGTGGRLAPFSPHTHTEAHARAHTHTQRK